MICVVLCSLFLKVDVTWSSISSIIIYPSRGHHVRLNYDEMVKVAIWKDWFIRGISQGAQKPDSPKYECHRPSDLRVYIPPGFQLGFNQGCLSSAAAAARSSGTHRSMCPMKSRKGSISDPSNLSRKATGLTGFPFHFPMPICQCTCTQKNS